MVQITEVTIRLAYEECCNCGVVFGMSESLQKKRIQDKGYFWCPNGHQQHYTGISSDQEIKNLKQQVEHQKNVIGIRVMDLKTEKSAHRRTAGKLGATTKKLKRVGNGVCPDCNRSFKNLRRHMEVKHAA